MQSRAKIFSAIFLFAALFSSATFFSCENSSDSGAALFLLAQGNGQGAKSEGAQGGQPGENYSADGKRIVVLHGTVGSNGALPKSIAAAAGLVAQSSSGSGISSSAGPDISLGHGFEHFARAEVVNESGDVVATAEGTFGTGANSNKFDIPLEVGRTWTVYCGTRMDTSPFTEVYVDSFEKEVTLEEPTLTHNFFPKPRTEGDGSVELKITIGTSGPVAAIEAVWVDEDLQASHPIAVDDTADAGIKQLTASNLPCGIYGLSISFKDTNGVLLYSTAQTVSVFAEMTSDTWTSSAGDGSDGIDPATGLFKVDGSFVKSVLDRTIYVGDIAALAANPITKAADDKNSGTAFEPLASAQAAFNKIKDYGSGAVDYTIYISAAYDESDAENKSGLVGTATLPGGADGLDGKARSILIAGLNGLDAGGRPVDALVGDGGSGPSAGLKPNALDVQTSVPIVIKNLKVTGKAGRSSRGINVNNEDASVTLQSGVEVTGFSYNYSGAGVCVAKGSLYIKGAKISKNSSGESGGGVYIGDDSHAKVYFSSGEICENQAHGSFGGGVKVESSGSLKMTGGKISGNTAAQKGGGIYNEGYVNISGGSVSANKATDGVNAKDGGAICAGGSSATVVGRAAKIPYGDADGNKGRGKNDVFLNKTDTADPVITLSDSAGAGAEKIAVALARWKRGDKIAAPESGTLSASAADRFYLCDPAISDTNPQGDEWAAARSADGKKLCINAPIYVGKDPAGNNGDDLNSGTRSSPYASLLQACKDMNDAGVDFTININGTVSGPQKIPSQLGKNASDVTKSYFAKSVLIKGVTAIPTAGAYKDIPQDKIDAVGTGSALKVESGVPVTIQNLTITNGGGSDKGGGVNMESGSDVTIESGVLITENTAKTSGGGICSFGGALKIKGGKICKNHIASNSYDNNRGGVGVFVGGSASVAQTNFEMSGGEICENEDSSDVDVNGGGVKIRNGAGTVVFTMTGGKITKNKTAKSGANVYSDQAKIILKGAAEISYGVIDVSGTAAGAGVMLDGGAALEMSGGKIFGNKASTSSATADSVAGVHIDALSSFAMTGGEIYGNVATGGKTRGGALCVKGSFSIGGSASVPYGVENESNVLVKAAGRNDICLPRYSTTVAGVDTMVQKTITVEDSLASHNAGTIGVSLSDWRRGAAILSADGSFSFEGVEEKFALTSDPDDGWEKMVAADKKSVTINAPIYVGQAPDGATQGDDDLNNGTKSKPFASIERACKEMNDAATDYIINVNGTLTKEQTVPSSLKAEDDGESPSYFAKSVYIHGVNGLYADGEQKDEPKDSINMASVPDSEKKTALTIASKVPVTIEDLKICNARNFSSSDCCGGGVLLKAGGTLKLGNGAFISNNKAHTGGGLYVASTAKVFMYGSALVGDKKETAATSSDCSNKATSRGGGAFVAGTLYMGYSGFEEDGTTLHEETLAGGICRNGSDSYVQGGGIYLSVDGKLVMASGNVCNNCAPNLNGSTLGIGGGIYISIQNASCDILGGNIGAAGKENTASQGGAIYMAGANDGGLFVSENASVCGSVFLDAQTMDGTMRRAKITVKGDLAKHGETSPIKVRMAEWKRGEAFLKVADGSSFEISEALAKKFALDGVSDDDEWGKIISADKKSVTIDAPIYVGAGGDNDNNGTYSYPFKTVARACQELNDAEKDWTIFVKGKVSGKQSVPNTLKSEVAAGETGKYYAKTLTLEGKIKTGLADPQIDAGLADAAADGSALTVNSAVPLSIKNLKITGGNTTTDGGGIKVPDGATVVLDQGSLVEGNFAQGDGAGVWVGGTLKVLSNPTVWGNKKTDDTGSAVGDSNVYLPDGKKILVAGLLKKDTDKAKIGVTTYEPPVVGTPTAAFTDGYGFKSGGNNNSVYPGSYFVGDKYTVALEAVSGSDGGDEGILAVGGGSITIDDVYKNVVLAPDKNWVNVKSPDSAVQRIDFTANLVNPGGTKTKLSFGDRDQSGKIYFEAEVLFHGEPVPPSQNSVTYYIVSYYGGSGSTPSTGSVYFRSALPAGTYTVKATGVYEGRTYSTALDVKLTNATVKDFFTEVQNPNPRIAPYGSDVSDSNAKYVLLGQWPQTIKAKDVEVYENSSKRLGQVSSSSSSYGYLYCYQGSDGNWYVPVTASASNDYTYSDGRPVVAGKEWFKVEPIKWRVITENYEQYDGFSKRCRKATGKWLLMSDKVLEKQEFQPLRNNDIRNKSGDYNKEQYWQVSQIRAYLNSTTHVGKSRENDTTYQGYRSFMATAFGGMTGKLYSVKLDTSSRNTKTDATMANDSEDGPYIWDQSSVFLLCRQELTNTSYGFDAGVDADSARIREATDYAKAQGVPKSGDGPGVDWFTRSQNGDRDVYGVDSTGTFKGYFGTSSSYGVVPCVCVNPMD